jgi:hypothetical protein
MFANNDYKGNLDSFLRTFHKVLQNKNLTLLQKYILCDIISLKIQGRSYFKTAAQLARELGNYSPRTVQTAYQWLNDNGYINTQPYAIGSHPNDLREVEVVQIEQWIYTDKFLEEIQFTVNPLVMKDENTPTNWKKKKCPKTEGKSTPKKKSKTEAIVIPDSEPESEIKPLDSPELSLAPDRTEAPLSPSEAKPLPKKRKKPKGENSEEKVNATELVNDATNSTDEKATGENDSTPTDLITLDNEKDIESRSTICQSIIDRLRNKEEVIFTTVKVRFDDGDIMIGEVTRVPNSNKYVDRGILEMMDKSLFEGQ